MDNIFKMGGWWLHLPPKTAVEKYNQYRWESILNIQYIKNNTKKEKVEITNYGYLRGISIMLAIIMVTIKYYCK